jgi:predicted GIY-YIG superfamily endonuclease
MNGNQFKFKYDKIYTYILKCPITNTVKYVGQSVTPQKRLKEHLGNPNPRFSQWYDKLNKLNLKPILICVSSHDTKKECDQIEKHLIEQFSKKYKLLNRRFNPTPPPMYGYNFKNT